MDVKITSSAFVLLFYMGALCCCLGAPQTGSQPDPQVQAAFESLLKVKQFAFGGVGFAATTSEGEKAFRSILASPEAVPLFRAVLKDGSDEARLYALFGLRQLDGKNFQAAAAPLQKANPDVKTVSGCVVMKEKAASVLRRIEKGGYDGWLRVSRPQNK